MMSVASVGWALAGAVAGIAHSLGIRQSATGASPAMAVIGLLRLVVIGGVLTAAAVSGFLLTAVAGWLTGFALTLVLLWRRMA